MGVTLNQQDPNSVTIQQGGSNSVSLTNSTPMSVTVSRVAVGSGDLHYTHTQSNATDQWVITHNLNKHPSVAVVDSGGNIVITEVRYDSANRLTVLFNSAESGKAYLN